MPAEGPGCQAHGTTNSPGGIPRLLVREKTRPARPHQRHFREKLRPARHKPPILGHYEHAGRTISRRHPPPGHAGRTFSRSRHSHVATMQPMTPLRPLMQASVKPPSPMLAPKQRPLKPASPLHPKTAPKTPISHPQRRWRFQLRLGRRPQRRQGFQTSGPPGSRVPAASPAGINVPAAPKTRMQFDWESFQQRLETLQSQRCKFIV